MHNDFCTDSNLTYIFLLFMLTNKHSQIVTNPRI